MRRPSRGTSRICARRHTAFAVSPGLRAKGCAGGENGGAERGRSDCLLAQQVRDERLVPRGHVRAVDARPARRVRSRVERVARGGLVKIALHRPPQRIERVARRAAHVVHEEVARRAAEQRVLRRLARRERADRVARGRLRRARGVPRGEGVRLRRVDEAERLRVLGARSVLQRGKTLPQLESTPARMAAVAVSLSSLYL